MLASLSKQDGSDIRLGSYRIRGQRDLIADVFTELGILKCRHGPIEINKTFLASKILSSSVDCYHVCNNMLTTPLIDSLCSDALTVESIDVSIEF